MPKIPINFENSIIYKFACLDTTYPEVYVGSTTNLKQRKSNHKSKCYNENAIEYNYKIYQYIREHGGFGNFAMIEIEKFPCENNRQLELREEFWRKELHATLNGQQSFTTPEERRIQNTEFNRKWQKNEGYDKHRLSVKKYDDANKEKKKAYREANKEKIKLYMKEYHQRKKLEKLNLNKEIPETNII
jgi:hypothetical protein